MTKPVVSETNPLILRAEISLEHWMAREPTTEESRPGTCPRCGQASRCFRGRRQLGLHSHGFRSRVVMHSPTPLCQPRRVVVRARRYRCRSCGATCLVVPSEVLPRRRYSAAAIGTLVASEACSRAIFRRYSNLVRRWVRKSAANLTSGSPHARLRRLAFVLASPVAGTGLGLVTCAHRGAAALRDPDRAVFLRLRRAHQVRPSRTASLRDHSCSASTQLHPAPSPAQRSDRRLPANVARGRPPDRRGHPA
jgi:hypothetical protein